PPSPKPADSILAPGRLLLSREQTGPGLPGQHDERVGLVAPEEQRVVLAEPSLELDEAGPGLARLHLGDQWRLVLAEDVNVNGVTAVAEPTAAGEGVSLAVDAERAMQLHELALDPGTFLTMSSTAHLSPLYAASRSAGPAAAGAGSSGGSIWQAAQG